MIEYDFNYKACCNDQDGVQMLGTKVYNPSSCSQRTCFYNEYLPFSQWISKQVRFHSDLIGFYQDCHHNFIFWTDDSWMRLLFEV